MFGYSLLTKDQLIRIRSDELDRGVRLAKSEIMQEILNIWASPEEQEQFLADVNRWYTNQDDCKQAELIVSKYCFEGELPAKSYSDVFGCLRWLNDTAMKRDGAVCMGFGDKYNARNQKYEGLRSHRKSLLTVRIVELQKELKEL